MDIRSLQRPLKDAYRQAPFSSRITLVANGRQNDAPISCSVDIGRAIYGAQAHKGVGGAGKLALLRFPCERSRDNGSLPLPRRGEAFL
jgi:hypothetical protein